MEKIELVRTIAEKYRIQAGQVEQVVNEVVLELASPYIFRKPGAEVGLLDNSCSNNCKEPGLAVQKPIATIK